MQLNITQLAKKAVSAALKLNWEEAIVINTEILQKDSDNIEAKLRLGRAYLYTKQNAKAKKMFKEVLVSDPINQVALKNLDLINSNKISLVKESSVDAKSLIKEPGTTLEIDIEITAKGFKAENLLSGEVLSLKVKKKSVDVFRPCKKEILIGSIVSPDIIARITRVYDKGYSCSISFIKGNDKKMTVMLRAPIPVFKSDKQDIRPYIKKGSLDEPDVDAEEGELLLTDADQ